MRAIKAHAGCGLSRRLVAVACCAALVVGLVPAAALMAPGDHAGEDASDGAREVDGLLADAVARVERHAQIEADAGEGVYQDDSIIVMGADGPRAEQVRSGMSVADAVFAAECDPQVSFAQPNYRYYLEGDAAQGTAAVLASAGAAIAPDAADAVPVNDPAAKVGSRSSSTPNQWWLYSVGAFDAWSLAKCEGKVSVAVIDTGVNFIHEDLKNVVDTTYAYDAAAGKHLFQSAKSQDYAHGCHVAGIVAGEANNGRGIAGVSYNANVIPIAAFFDYYDEEDMQNYTITDDETLMDAYAYLFSDPDGAGQTIAERTNLHVINMSLGSYLGDGAVDYAFEKIIQDAETAGVLTVASGGNGGAYGARTDPHYPSDFDEVVAVTALETDTEAAYFSDYNESKNIAAPGCSVYSTWWGGERSYYYADGTSMASPLVAGCAALLWAYDPDLTVAEAKRALYSTATDLGDMGFDAHYGWGKVNPAAAISSLGAVHVDSESREMSVATTQKLSARVIAASAYAGSDYEWSWSTSDPAIATVSQTGVLTARAAGTVTVNVQARYNPSIEGSTEVQVSTIAIPGEVTAASDRNANAVNVRWAAAAGATSYEVYRADKPGAPVGKIAAKAGEGSCLFADAAVTGGVSYSYRVQPIGTLEGSRVEGDWSNTASVLHVNRATLRAGIDSANALMEKTTAAASGAGISSKKYWAPQSAFDALESAVGDAAGVYIATSPTQLQIDDQTAALARATAAFKSARSKGSVLPAPKKQSISLKAKAQAVKYAKVKRSAQKVKGALSVKGAKTAVSFKISKVSKAKLAKFFAIDAKGVITVKKGCPKGVYRLAVKATAKATSKYALSTGAAKVTVKVK